MTRAKRILIADFFGSLKARGIPAYVRDLEGVAATFAQVQQLRAPLWMRKAPPGIQNLAMVLHEQLWVPLVVASTRPDAIVFPYNSASFLCSLFSRRSVCIIHDLIPYRKQHRAVSPAYLYLWATTRFHAAMQRTFAGVSPYTMRLLAKVERFRHCEQLYIPNCFSQSAHLQPARVAHAATVDRLTLITGHSRNKDFSGALTLYRAYCRRQGLSALGLDVVGFGDRADWGRAVLKTVDTDDTLRHVVIHDLLPQNVLDDMLRSNRITWAHSTAEGFGRVVVEGRLAGRAVLMSRLAVFRPFSDRWTFAYRNGDTTSFLTMLDQALASANTPEPYTVVQALQRQATVSMKSLVERS